MKLCRFYHTVRYLKPIQIYRRVWFKCYKPKAIDKPAPRPRVAKKQWYVSIKKPNSFLPPDQFTFLNQTFSPPLASIKDKLWRYNFHYFDYLQAESANQHVTELNQLIEGWIMDNPAPKGDGWEPYPLSLRIVNWIKWQLSGNQLSERALKSLANQVRYLTKRLEYHLLGNHLFANAKALFFAGLFFTGREADEWFNKACQILAKQLPEQILKDGGHFELSPMYHGIILEDILDMINVANTYQKRLVFDLPDYAQRMLQWLSVMSHPDGEVAFFNDAALGIAANLKALKGYAGLCIKKDNPPQPPLIKGGEKCFVSSPDKGKQGGIFSLPESGYYRYDTKNYTAIIDAGAIGPDYLPGHAHADTLSFELSVKNQRVIVNSGTSCYDNSAERLRERGTAAHNTLVIDHQNSSDVWGSFRVARRAKIVKRELKNNALIAAHNGYQRLSGKPTHQRTWKFKDDAFTIKDEVLGKGRHDIAIYFHFHPDLNLSLDGGQLLVANKQGEQILTIKIDESFSAQLLGGTFHSEFGLSQKNNVLCLQAEISLPCEVNTSIFTA